MGGMEMDRAFLALLLALPLLMGCMSPLQEAAYNGQTDRIDLLLAQGVEVDETPHHKLTALMWAAQFGQNQAVKLLLDKGAKIDALDPRYRTALWYAAEQGNLETAKILCERGADLFQLDLTGRSASAVAREGGFLEVQRYLEDAERKASAGKGLSKEELQKTVGEEIKKSRDQELSSKPARRSEVDAPAYRLPERPDDYALVVGIEKYKALPDADYALRDAEGVRRHLEAMGYPRRNIIYLVGANATRSALQSYLEEWLPKNVKTDSEVFIYYSGHGAPDAESGQAYLVPWDANPAFLKSTGYSTRRLYDSLGELKAKAVVVALDACFSGLGGRSVLPKGARPLVNKVSTGFEAKPNMVLFTAAAEAEITTTLDEQGHGIFTYFFLKGLGGHAKDSVGNVTIDGLYWYLKPLVEEEARRQNRDQTPLLIGTATNQSLVKFVP